MLPVRNAGLVLETAHRRATKPKADQHFLVQRRIGGNEAEARSAGAVRGGTSSKAKPKPIRQRF
jgi:hypothetical protein